MNSGEGEKELEGETEREVRKFSEKLTGRLKETGRDAGNG